MIRIPVTAIGSQFSAVYKGVKLNKATMQGEAYAAQAVEGDPTALAKRIGKGYDQAVRFDPAATPELVAPDTYIAGYIVDATAPADVAPAKGKPKG